MSSFQMKGDEALYQESDNENAKRNQGSQSYCRDRIDRTSQLYGLGREGSQRDKPEPDDKLSAWVTGAGI